MTTRPRQTDATRRTRGGFVLPMVLLVMIVGTVMTAVMLDRQGVQARSVRRQLDQYQEHHGTKGLTEVLQAWLGTLRNQPIAEVIGGDPHVLDLILADRSRVSVYLVDGQAPALAIFAHLIPEDRLHAEAIYGNLVQFEDRARLVELTRIAGPVAVSAQTASREVLAAVVRYASGGLDPDDMVADLMRTRQDEQLTAASISAVAAAAGLDAEARGMFNRLLAATPSVWRIRVEIRPPRVPGTPDRPVSVYEGLVDLSPRVTGSQPSSIFLSFEPARVQ